MANDLMIIHRAEILAFIAHRRPDPTNRLMASVLLVSSGEKSCDQFRGDKPQDVVGFK